MKWLPDLSDLQHRERFIIPLAEQSPFFVDLIFMCDASFAFQWVVTYIRCRGLLSHSPFVLKYNKQGSDFEAKVKTPIILYIRSYSTMYSNESIPKGTDWH